jgi:hypothetical protein
MPADKDEKVYEEVIDMFTTAVSFSASGAGFVFDGIDFTEFKKKLADRKKIISSLKKKMKKGGIKASQWTPVMAKLDQLSRIDRDIQLRQRSRIGAFRRRGFTTGLGIISLGTMKDSLEKIQA